MPHRTLLLAAAHRQRRDPIDFASGDVHHLLAQHIDGAAFVAGKNRHHSRFKLKSGAAMGDDTAGSSSPSKEETIDHANLGSHPAATGDQEQPAKRDDR